LGFPDSTGAPERLAGFYVLTSSLVKRDENAGANEVSEAGSRALETLTNKYELECLKTGDRIPSPAPESLTEIHSLGGFLFKQNE